MVGRHLALIAVFALVGGAAPIQASDGLKLPSNVNQSQAGSATSTAAKKKKKTKRKGAKNGKTKDNTQKFMTIKMQDAPITGRQVPQGNRSLQGGLLDALGGAFNRNPPSQVGTPIAPKAGGVIK